MRRRPRTFPQGWQLGTPDLVLNVGEDFQLGADGQGPVPLLRAADQLDRGPLRHRRRDPARQSARRPSRAAVHRRAGQGAQARTGAEAKSAVKEKEQDDRHAGSAQRRRPRLHGQHGRRLHTAARRHGRLGTGADRPLSAGRLGLLLPKKSDIIMQVHYHRDGRAEKDRTQIGLYFAKKKVEQAVPGRRPSPGRAVWPGPVLHHPGRGGTASPAGRHVGHARTSPCTPSARTCT